MTDSAWLYTSRCARNEASRGGASTPLPALDIGNLIGGYDMPVDGNITVRGDSASADKSQNWKSIGDLARALAEKAAQK